MKTEMSNCNSATCRNTQQLFNYEDKVNSIGKPIKSGRCTVCNAYKQLPQYKDSGSFIGFVHNGMIVPERNNAHSSEFISRINGKRVKVNVQIIEEG